MIRYIKRFTGSKTNPAYVVQMQQQVPSGLWIDLNPNDAIWETELDERKFEAASQAMYLKERR